MNAGNAGKRTGSVGAAGEVGMTGSAGGTGSGASSPGADKAANPLRRFADWWHEPHFLNKDSIIGAALILVEIIVMPPSSPAQMLLALCWLAMVALLPFRAPAVCAVAPFVFLAASLLPHEWWWASGGVAIVVVFLAVGYSLSDAATAILLVGYSVVDAILFVTLGSQSIGGSAIEGTVSAFNDIGMDGPAPNHPVTQLPHYSMIVLIATVVLDLMVLGFLVMIGRAFRRASAADERVARAERMLGRVTREQELAHMIHDSVANDMSTIAMLAWRAKAMDDDTAMLDTIYARSHHALDRVHAVIDVLNGRHGLDELIGETAGDAGRDAGEASFDTQLEKYVEDQDRTMTMLGLSGVSRFNSAPDVAVPKPVQRVVMELVEEIYANIVRHCAMPKPAVPGAGAAPGTGAEANDDEPAYSLFIDIEPDGIRVSEVNALVDETTTLMHGRRHGGGLEMHRAAVEALGGVLNTSNQEGAWTISARVPLA